MERNAELLQQTVKMICLFATCYGTQVDDQAYLDAASLGGGLPKCIKGLVPSAESLAMARKGMDQLLKEAPSKQQTSSCAQLNVLCSRSIKCMN